MHVSCHALCPKARSTIFYSLPASLLPAASLSSPLGLIVTSDGKQKRRQFTVATIIVFAYCKNKKRKIYQYPYQGSNSIINFVLYSKFVCQHLISNNPKSPRFSNRNMSSISVLTLYRHMLKNASLITHYNFRSYAIRRIKHDFREYKGLVDGDRLSAVHQDAFQKLELLKRQRIISQLYPESNSVLEH